MSDHPPIKYPGTTYWFTHYSDKWGRRPVSVVRCEYPGCTDERWKKPNCYTVSTPYTWQPEWASHHGCDRMTRNVEEPWIEKWYLPATIKDFYEWEDFIRTRMGWTPGKKRWKGQTKLEALNYDRVLQGLEELASLPEVKQETLF